MQNMRLCCFSLFDLQDPLDVVDHDVDHQRHQKHQAREVNHTLQVSPDWFSADGFYAVSYTHLTLPTNREV